METEMNGACGHCADSRRDHAADGTWIGGERTRGLRSYSTTYDSTAGTITVG
jgi:hypothetical protein